MSLITSAYSPHEWERVTDAGSRSLSAREFVTLVRRSVVYGEHFDALRELTKSTPCDGCAMFERCKVEKLACRAFFVYVHRDGEGSQVVWRNIQRKPSHALYDAVMAAAAPDTVVTVGGRIWSLVDLETELRGKYIGGRMVLTVGARKKQRGQQVATVTLHCHLCNHIETVELSHAYRPDCFCVCRPAGTPEACEAAQEQARAEREELAAISAAANARAKADNERRRAEAQPCAP